MRARVTVRGGPVCGRRWFKVEARVQLYHTKADDTPTQRCVNMEAKREREREGSDSSMSRAAHSSPEPLERMID